MYHQPSENLSLRDQLLPMVQDTQLGHLQPTELLLDRPFKDEWL